MTSAEALARGGDCWAKHQDALSMGVLSHWDKAGQQWDILAAELTLIETGPHTGETCRWQTEDAKGGYPRCHKRAPGMILEGENAGEDDWPICKADNICGSDWEPEPEKETA